MEIAPPGDAEASGMVIDDAIGEAPPAREEEDLAEPAVPDRVPRVRRPAVGRSTFVTGVDEMPLLDTIEAAAEAAPLPTDEASRSH
jgi:hypothetical protein